MATVTTPAEPVSPTPPRERLSVGSKLAFGVGDTGPAIVFTIVQFSQAFFLLNVAGLRPAAAGAILLIVRIWDAINDPLIGALTDRTNTRWGRRRPWLLFGAVPFGLAFFLNWIVPPFSDAGKFVYYLLVLLLMDTAYTAINVPYTALTPELSHDYDERTSLNSYRFSFSILGGVIAAALHELIVGAYPDTSPVGYVLSAALWGVVLAATALTTFAFTRERHFKEKHEEGPGFFDGLRIAFSNRAFIYATLVYLLSWLALQFVAPNLKFYVAYWMQAEELFVPLILILQVGNFVFLLVWSRISQRIGKHPVYYIGAAIWIVAQIGLWFVQPEQTTLLFVLALFAAVGVSVGAYLVPWSLLPDVIEWDELKTGQRREGVFYGFFVFLQKLGVSLGIAISLMVLDAMGYITPVEGEPLPDQPSAVVTALRVFVSFVPAVILLLSYIPMRLYPITRERHAEMRAELERRHAATD